MPPPLVSVIIPTYYRNDRLRQSLQSVKNQTYEPIECIVVDDSGEQHAQPVPEAFSDVVYFAHDVNKGAHAARDTGLRRADGSYIQFLDDDDELKPAKISSQVEYLEARDEVGVVYCGLIYEDGVEHPTKQNTQNDMLEETLRFYPDPLTTSTMLIDTNVLETIRPLCRESPGADDIRMTIRLAQRATIDCVDEVLVISGRSDDSRGASWSGVKGRWSILQDYDELYDTVPPDVRRDALADTYQLQGRRQLEDHVWSPGAIYSFGQAVRYAPEVTVGHVGELISSFAGRPGRKIAQYMLSLSIKYGNLI